MGQLYCGGTRNARPADTSYNQMLNARCHAMGCQVLRLVMELAETSEFCKRVKLAQAVGR